MVKEVPCEKTSVHDDHYYTKIFEGLGFTFYCQGLREDNTTNDWRDETVTKGELTNAIIQAADVFTEEYMAKAKALSEKNTLAADVQINIIYSNSTAVGKFALYLKRAIAGEELKK